MGSRVFGLVLGVAWAALMAQPIRALPFNDDMVEIQPGPGQVMRPAPKGSVPLGANERYVPDFSAALEMDNPVEADARSLADGRRLYSVYCSPCHGGFTERGQWIKQGLWNYEQYPIKGPDLSSTYLLKLPDGYMFGNIHFSRDAVMPRYGWKLSINDHWDVVNYLRELQRRRKAREISDAQ